MKWVIIILIVLAVLLAAALIWTAMKRKKQQVARERAGELRSEAATSATAKQEQEARAREAEAEAERVRAQADKLDARAQEERTSYDQTRATQEDRLREADRLDPDVNHRDPDYRPGAPSAPGEHTPGHTAGQHTAPGEHTEGKRSQTQNPAHSAGEANPVPPGPETTAPEPTGSEEQDRLTWEREQARRDQI
jgi:TolA-binding protein